jgi:hypothetical protein
MSEPATPSSDGSVARETLFATNTPVAEVFANGLAVTGLFGREPTSETRSDSAIGASIQDEPEMELPRSKPVEDPSNQRATTPAAKSTKRSRLAAVWAAVVSGVKARSLASLTYDVVQIVSSMADVILDVVVAVEFYRSGFYGLFIAQATVFAFANLTYAFIFTATWGRELTSATKKSLVFWCVMPVAQLLPLFTYLESFHFAEVDAMILNLGLSPTTPYAHSNSALGLDDDDDNDGIDPAPDSVFELLRRKYQAHAGMIAGMYGFVEALCLSTFVQVGGWIV